MSESSPQTDPWTLSSGREVQLQMPDLYAILATVGTVPNQLMIEVLNLLDQEGAILPGSDEGQKFLRIRNRIRGMYALCSLIIVSPRLVLTGTPEPGEIGTSELTINDVEALYYRYFRGGYRPPPRRSPDPAESDGTEEPVPDLSDVRDDAEPVPADR